MELTLYEKELLILIGEKYPDLPHQTLLENLIRMGVLDPVNCKVLVIRTYIDSLVRQGIKKLDAMWLATEKFACTYEYVRRCMYYYRDINLI